MPLFRKTKFYLSYPSVHFSLSLYRGTPHFPGKCMTKISSRVFRRKKGHSSLSLSLMEVNLSESLVPEKPDPFVRSDIPDILNCDCCKWRYLYNRDLWIFLFVIGVIAWLIVIQINMATQNADFEILKEAIQNLEYCTKCPLPLNR